MKKNFGFLFLFFLLLLRGSLLGQTVQADANQSSSSSTFYVILNLGYNFDNISEKFVGVTRYAHQSVYTSTAFHSFGAGFLYGGGIGLRLNNTYSVEINADYLSGNSIETMNGYPDIEIGYYENNSYKSSALFLSPAIVVNLQGFPAGIAPYVKIGALFGFPTIKNEYRYFDNYNEKWNMQRENKEKGGVALGYRVNVGLRYALTSTFSLIGELSFNAITWEPRNYSQGSKNLEYAQTITTGDFDHILQKSHSFNAIGLRGGVLINL